MTMQWATVTEVGPLRITLDGDTAPLPYVPDSLVDPASLVLTDRVRCELENRRVVIVGRSGGDGFIGEHRPGEWAASPSPRWLLANGATHLIADYPKLAAHYAATYGSANFHGGDGTTTFAVPDTRERVYVNQGGSDIFAAIGGKTGTKTHTLTPAQTPESYAKSSQSGTQRWRASSGQYDVGSLPSGAFRVLISTGSGDTQDAVLRTEGGGQSHNNVQPSFVCRFIIRAA